MYIQQHNNNTTSGFGENLSPMYLGRTFLEIYIEFLISNNRCMTNTREGLRHFLLSRGESIVLNDKVSQT
jgi:hypothetical protein